MKLYDRQLATAYAQRWALDANPSFYHFGGIGGDCTNFISQCLLAGGCKMIYDKTLGWYYQSINDRSPSWTSVAYLQNFLLTSKRGTITTLDKLQMGDLIQLRQNPSHFNHTLFVSKITQQEIYVCAHSNDALNRPLSSYQFQQLLPIHIQKSE